MPTVGLAIGVETQKLNASAQQFGATGTGDRLVECGALGKALRSGLLDPAADEDLNEIRREVGAAGGQQLIPQELLRAPNLDHITIEETDIDALIPLGDEREEVHLGLRLSAPLAHGLLANDFDRGKIGIGGHALGGAQGVKQGGPTVWR